MATMDIFEGDAFTIVELTRALENIPYKPALLSGSALFSSRGVRARTVVIESRDGTVNGGAKVGHVAAQNQASGGAPSAMACALVT